MSPVEFDASTTAKPRSAPAARKSRQRTLIERVSLITDVRQEEAAGALLMTLLMFLILAAYDV